jgi:hypothetical protein
MRATQFLVDRPVPVHRPNGAKTPSLADAARPGALEQQGVQISEEFAQKSAVVLEKVPDDKSDNADS